MQSELERYRAIYNFSPLIIAVLDKNGVILDINKRLTEWTGYNSKDVIGKSLLELPFISKKDKAEVRRRLMDKVDDQKISSSYVVSLVGKNKKKIILSSKSVRIRDKNNKIIGYIVMVCDVTDLKRVERKMRIKDIAVESSVNPIALASPKGILTYVNPSFVKMWGYDNAREIIGRPIADFWRIREEEVAKLSEFLEEKQGCIGEMTAKRKNGSLFEVETSASVIKEKSGKPICLMGSFIDITEQKRISRAKTEFVSLASHQLKTPLTNIGWHVESLLKKDFGKVSKKQREYLEIIYNSNLRLVKLVNALLNVSRIELDTFAINSQPINVIEIAENVLKEFSRQIKEKRLKLEKNFDKLSIIKTDANLIRIVFQNLLSNSVKYTPRNAKIVFSLKRKNSDLLIRVSDTGYGIPKEQQSEMFAKFFRGDNIRRGEQDGTGLGLYITKSIVEKSNGKIWFKSKENEGTAFYVRIPLKGAKGKKGDKQLI